MKTRILIIATLLSSFVGIVASDHSAEDREAIRNAKIQFARDWLAARKPAIRLLELFNGDPVEDLVKQMIANIDNKQSGT